MCLCRVPSHTCTWRQVLDRAQKSKCWRHRLCDIRLGAQQQPLASGVPFVTPNNSTTVQQQHMHQPSPPALWFYTHHTATMASSTAQHVGTDLGIAALTTGMNCAHSNKLPAPPILQPATTCGCVGGQDPTLRAGTGPAAAAAWAAPTTPAAWRLHTWSAAGSSAAASPSPAHNRALKPPHHLSQHAAPQLHHHAQRGPPPPPPPTTPP